MVGYEYTEKFIRDDMRESDIIIVSLDKKQLLFGGLTVGWVNNQSGFRRNYYQFVHKQLNSAAIISDERHGKVMSSHICREMTDGLDVENHPIYYFKWTLCIDRNMYTKIAESVITEGSTKKLFEAIHKHV